MFQAATLTIAIDRIVRTLAAAPGRKVVLLVTEGFPSASLSPMTPEAAQAAMALQKLHDAVIRDVNSANVTSIPS